MRAARLALAGLLFIPSALAQTPCVDGQAGPYACNRVDLAARLPVSTFAVPGSPAPGGNSDIWGWTDTTTGREYALVGSDNGTSFVDVTEPAAPVFLGKLPTPPVGPGVDPVIWRDIKVDGDFAFIVSEARDHGMQVFDLRRLRNVASPPETFTADARYTGAGKSHNIVINEDAGIAYLVGANQGGYACNGGGLHMVDISTPTAPTFAGCYDDAGYTHDAECISYIGGDSDHQGKNICVGYNEDRVAIVDVTDPAAATMISEGFYPNPGYTHQGWFSADRNYLIIDDELDRSQSPTTRTIVMDVSDLDDPTFDFFHFGTTTARDHNLYTVGVLAYQSNYSAGLRILDTRNIANGSMQEIAFFDTYPADDDYNFDGQWSNYPYFGSGTVVANDSDNGLFVLRPDANLLVDSGATPAPSASALSLPRPNPTAGTSELTLSVESAQTVRAEVFDVSGRRVATLFDGAAAPGADVTLTVDGAGLPAGVYLVRVQGETFDAAQRLTITR